MVLGPQKIQMHPMTNRQSRQTERECISRAEVVREPFYCAFRDELLVNLRN